jgi:hypothetical protein
VRSEVTLPVLPVCSRDRSMCGRQIPGAGTHFSSVAAGLPAATARQRPRVIPAAVPTQSGSCSL